jgi:hypothetical protein
MVWEIDAHQIVRGFVRRFVSEFVRVDGPEEKLESQQPSSRWTYGHASARSWHLSKGGQLFVDSSIHNQL